MKSAYPNFIQKGDTVHVQLLGDGGNISGEVISTPNEADHEWVIRSKQHHAEGDIYYIRDYVFIHLQAKGEQKQ